LRIVTGIDYKECGQGAITVHSKYVITIATFRWPSSCLTTTQEAVSQFVYISRLRLGCRIMNYRDHHNNVEHLYLLLHSHLAWRGERRATGSAIPSRDKPTCYPPHLYLVVK
jgi:hypothetical protein